MPADIGAELVSILPRLRRYALTLSHSATAADDLVQGACVKALSRADSFTPGTRFDSWMFCILRNQWIDGVRRLRTEGISVEFESQTSLVGSDGEAEAIERLSLEEVARALDDLSPEHREVLLLVCVEDLPYREAAEVMGVPIGTVMSRLARARQRILQLTGPA
jgi:RNA polymerase sigma-70 factor (ECF subfamily)